MAFALLTGFLALAAAYIPPVDTTNQARLEELVTIGIKATPAFPERRATLNALLKSIRSMYGEKIRIVVATEAVDEFPGVEEFHAATLKSDADHIPLPPFVYGLSAGRNALVEATNTKYLVILDDDTKFYERTSLVSLLNAMESHPNATVVGGCYAPEAGPYCGVDFIETPNSLVVPDGRSLPARVDGSSSSPSCREADITENFFMARTESLRMFKWDPRQATMEHETFFYQLRINKAQVLVCDDVRVLHERPTGKASAEYRKESERYRPALTMQYFCKDFPWIETLRTPFHEWHCSSRTFCTERANGAWQCGLPMQWMEEDERQLVLAPSADQFNLELSLTHQLREMQDMAPLPTMAPEASPSPNPCPEDCIPEGEPARTLLFSSLPRCPEGCVPATA